MLKRPLAGFAAFVAANLCTVMAAPIGHADNQVQIDEKVKDSIVYVSIAFTGYVQIPGSATDNGQPMWSDAAEVDYTCSGFVVDPAGYIATAGHCVNIDPATKEDIRSQMVANLVDNGRLDKSKQDDFSARANNEEWLIEGKEAGSPIIRQVQVVQPEGPHRVINQFTTAQVVDVQNFDDGDNALLKVSGMPPLQPLVIADKAPDPGTSLTSVGFPGNIGDSSDKSRLQQPSFKSGTASSQQVSKTGVAGTEINADLGSGMSGGPTVDNDTGEVLGINSYSQTGSSNGVNQNFNFITNAPALRTFLQKNGVHLAEAAKPAKSFPWMWVIVGIAAVLAVVVGILIALLVRKRRSAPVSAAVGAPAGAWSPAGGQPVPTGPTSGPTPVPPVAPPTPPTSTDGPSAGSTPT